MKDDSEIWTVVDINERDKFGNTALHYAAKAGNLEEVKTLVEAGVDVLIRNDEGKTAKQVAIDNKITSLGKLYNAAVSKIGGASYENTQPVYEYLDEVEKELAKKQVREEARSELEIARMELDIEKFKGVLHAAAEEQIEIDKKMEKQAALDDDHEETLKVERIRTQSEDERDVEGLGEDLKVLNEELEEILATQQYKRDPSKPVVELSEEEYADMAHQLRRSSSFSGLSNEDKRGLKIVAANLKGQVSAEPSPYASSPHCATAKSKTGKLTVG